MDTIDVVYVTAPRCHFCERGRTVLAGLADRYRLRVREVALTSEEGRDIAARWRVPYPPILLVDGHLAGYGRLSNRALDRILTDVPAPGRSPACGWPSSHRSPRSGCSSPPP